MSGCGSGGRVLVVLELLACLRDELMMRMLR